jgi:glucose-1-phosphate thymidylyltransferase
MKAVILAGGEGTRLYPITKVANKHLLPIYDRPVIQYAVEKMISFGIKEVMIITNALYLPNFKRLFADEDRCRIVYKVQSEPKGIAHGLHLAKSFIGKDSFLFWLGDGIVEDDISRHIHSFVAGAKVFIKRVNDPERFGVATVDRKHHVLEIIEKPTEPKSHYAVTGIYLYDSTVFTKMKGQPVSKRGEYEITYLNNKYIEEGTLKAVFLKKQWFDIGTFESLHKASNYIRQKVRKSQGIHKKNS